MEIENRQESPPDTYPQHEKRAQRGLLAALLMTQSLTSISIRKYASFEPTADAKYEDADYSSRAHLPLRPTSPGNLNKEIKHDLL